MNLKTSFSFVLILTFLSFTTAQTEEYIQKYDVEIQLNKDRSIDVEENIQVYFMEDARGLTRSFPTKRSIDNKSVDTKYQNLQVYKNGNSEPFTKGKSDDDDLYYIGSQDVILDPGYYQYNITYSVPNQIIFDDGKVQLRWNAIGTDVVFRSEKAKVTVKFEEDMKFLDSKMYVGKYGSGQNEARVKETRQGNEIVYNIDEGLTSNEAVTIEIDLASESVVAPTFFQKYSSFLTLLLGGLAMFFYFILTWFKYGRDPKPNPSALLYDTPENLSPASINYIEQERYTGRALTSSLIALATKGFIKISKDGESGIFKKEVYTIEKLRNTDGELPVEQANIIDTLFSKNSTVYLDGEYQKVVQATRRSHQVVLQTQHREFVKKGNNLKFILYPILILIVVLVISSILANTIEINSYPHFKNVLIFIPLSIVSLIIYRYLIIQPTVERLNLQEEIKAFKQYIEMNVNDLSKLNDAPERDISHFESLLPYAYALGVESNWSDSFSDIMKQSSYSPDWSGGHYRHSGMHQGLYYGVQSTATKPQPKSSGSRGSSGGGGSFAGGGGGGGGVGRW